MTEPFEGPVRHVYVHVPFCRAKCDYCEFASVPVDVDAADGRAGAQAARRLDEYVDGVAAEWERERAAHDVRRLRTLYLGGGTPSLLGPDRLERLLELFRPHLTPHAEVTVETNPEDVDGTYAGWAAGAGRAHLARRAELLRGAARRARPDGASGSGRAPSAACAPPASRTPDSTSSTASRARRRSCSPPISPPSSSCARTTSPGTSST